MNTIIDTILDAAVIIAPITAIIMLLPQVPETWRIRNDAEKLRGVSVGTQIFMGINSIMWLLMGVAMESFSVAAASFVTLPVIVFTLFLVFRSRRRERLSTLTSSIAEGRGTGSTTSVAPVVTPARG